MFGTWPSLIQILAVAVGGSVGSLGRFFVGHFFVQWFGAGFPWGTLFVNVVGSTFLGWFLTFALQRPGAIDPSVRLLFASGLAGGFTTFSSLSIETIALYQQGDLKAACLNLGLNLVVGFGGTVLGILIARLT